MLTLPEPPSANRWWRRHGHIVHLSRDAATYKARVAQQLGVNGEPRFPMQDLGVLLVWHRRRLSGDLDKRLGVLLDALQGSVYASDAQIVRIWAERVDAHPEVPKGHIRIEVREV